MRLGISQNISSYFYHQKKNIRNEKHNIEIKVFYRIFILNILITLIFLSFKSDTFDYLEQIRAEIYKNYFTQDYLVTLKNVNQYLKNYSEDTAIIEIKGKTLFKLIFTEPWCNNIPPDQKEKLIDQAIISFESLLTSKNYRCYSFTEFFTYLSYLYFLKGKDYYKAVFQFIKLTIDANKSERKLKPFLKENEFILLLEGKLSKVSFYELGGYVTFKLKKYKTSINFFRKALAEKKQSIYFFYLGHLYKHINDIKKAIAHFEYVSCIEENQELVNNSLLMLINIYESQENWDNVNKYLQKYLKTASKDADLCYKQGEIYEKQNKIKLAISSWQEALTYNPNHPLSRIKLLRYSPNLLRKQKSDDTTPKKTESKKNKSKGNKD